LPRMPDRRHLCRRSLCLLKPLCTFFNLFQHGGRPMRYITDRDYRTLLSIDDIKAMFRLGLTYRPGFLVNSFELSGAVHIPKADILGFRMPVINVIKALPVQNKDIHEGTPIGSYEYTGQTHPVCIPLYLRPRSTHIIGKSGMAKSTTMAYMILDDIRRGLVWRSSIPMGISLTIAVLHPTGAY